MRTIRKIRCADTVPAARKHDRFRIFRQPGSVNPPTALPCRSGEGGIVHPAKSAGPEPRGNGTEPYYRTGRILRSIVGADDRLRKRPAVRRIHPANRVVAACKRFRTHEPFDTATDCDRLQPASRRNRVEDMSRRNEFLRRLPAKQPLRKFDSIFSKKRTFFSKNICKQLFVS